MLLSDNFARLDEAGRSLVTLSYVATVRQLKTSDHPSLSSGNAAETSCLICWRLVGRAALGVKDADELEAYAIAGIDPWFLLHRLKNVRLKLEAKMARCEQLRVCARAPGHFNRSSLMVVLRDALEDLAATRAKYTRLLGMWADEPSRLRHFGLTAVS